MFFSVSSQEYFLFFPCLRRIMRWYRSTVWRCSNCRSFMMSCNFAVVSNSTMTRARPRSPDFLTSCSRLPNHFLMQQFLTSWRATVRIATRSILVLL